MYIHTYMYIHIHHRRRPRTWPPGAGRPWSARNAAAAPDGPQCINSHAHYCYFLLSLFNLYVYVLSFVCLTCMFVCMFTPGRCPRGARSPAAAPQYDTI